MVKIIMKQVPRTIDKSIQHDIMRKWSSVIVDTHTSQSHIGVLSGQKRTYENDNYHVIKRK